MCSSCTFCAVVGVHVLVHAHNVDNAVPFMTVYVYNSLSVVVVQLFDCCSTDDVNV